MMSLHRFFERLVFRLGALGESVMSGIEALDEGIIISLNGGREGLVRGFYRFPVGDTALIFILFEV